MTETRFALFTPDRCYGECGYCLKTTDPFCTGDSPTEYTCEAPDDSDCPLVDRVIDRVVVLLNQADTFRDMVAEADDEWIEELYKRWKTDDAKAIGWIREAMDDYARKLAVAEMSRVF